MGMRRTSGGCPHVYGISTVRATRHCRRIVERIVDLVQWPAYGDQLVQLQAAVAVVLDKPPGAVFVGGAIWLLYWAVGIKLALPLGTLATVTELVPILGTFIFLLVMVVAVVLADLSQASAGYRSSSS